MQMYDRTIYEDGMIIMLMNSDEPMKYRLSIIGRPARFCYNIPKR